MVRLTLDMPTELGNCDGASTYRARESREVEAPESGHGSGPNSGVCSGPDSRHGSGPDGAPTLVRWVETWAGA